jgi:hypothetical protein
MQSLGFMGKQKKAWLQVTAHDKGSRFVIIFSSQQTA